MPPQPGTATVVELQRTAGNAAVCGLVDKRAPTAPALVAIQRQTNAAEPPSLRELGDPTARPLARGNGRNVTRHPVVRPGATGSAVDELQQKLLRLELLRPGAYQAGVFDAATRRAVVEFQRALHVTARPLGVVEHETWALLDGFAPGATRGRVDYASEERVGGRRFSGRQRFDWELTMHDALLGTLTVTVRIAFRGGPLTAVPAWLDAIQYTWNRFSAVNREARQRVDIVFRPQRVSSSGDRTVRVAQTASGREDEATWAPDSTGGTAAHEFGHMIGLDDEYQQDHRTMQRMTGELGPIYRLPHVTPGGRPIALDPRQVAQRLHAALRRRSARARVAEARAIAGEVLSVGPTESYERRAIGHLTNQEYTALFGRNLLHEVNSRISDRDARFVIAEAFTFTVGGLMGSDVPGHEHPVEPRHVRFFVQIVQAALGGTWIPVFTEREVARDVPTPF